MSEKSKQISTGFPAEVPSGSPKTVKKGLKEVARIVYWLIILGIVISYAQFILIAVVCTAGIGAIPLAAIGWVLYQLQKWMFKD